MEYKEFKEILKNKKLTLKEFANLSNTSYNTCLKWGRDERPVSNWVKPFLDLYIQNMELQKEVNKHISFKQEFYEMINGQTIVVK